MAISDYLTRQTDVPTNAGAYLDRFLNEESDLEPESFDMPGLTDHIEGHEHVLTISPDALETYYANSHKIEDIVDALGKRVVTYDPVSTNNKGAIYKFPVGVYTPLSMYDLAAQREGPEGHVHNTTIEIARHSNPQIDNVLKTFFGYNKLSQELAFFRAPQREI